MVLSDSEIDTYMRTYLELVVDDPSIRERIARKAKQRINEVSDSRYGSINSISQLHTTLDILLDGSRSRFSLDAILSDNDFTGHAVVAAESETPFAETRLRPIEREKGYYLLETLRLNIPKNKFNYLVACFRGLDNLAYLLGQSNLTDKAIISDSRNIVSRLAMFSGFGGDIRSTFIDYQRFREENLWSNPIQTLDARTLPIIDHVIQQISDTGIVSIRQGLLDRGFGGLLTSEGGARNLIERVEFANSLYSRPGQLYESNQRLLDSVEAALYTLEGFQEAVANNNQTKLALIINQLISRDISFLGFFKEFGDGYLARGNVDLTGRFSLKKTGSGKAILEFYLDQRYPDLLDRTEPPYVQMWRMSGRGMWQSGQESVDLGLEAIFDVLCELPGYREAELTGDRDKQVDLINELLYNKTDLTGDFMKDIAHLMASFVDCSGNFGIKKIGSPKAVLEFYSNKKGLNWFDRTQQTYVQGWRIRENGMWQRGQESVDLALEAIFDVLCELPSYREAELSGDRDKQIEIIHGLVDDTIDLNQYFRKQLSGMMNILIDPTGNLGIRRVLSAKALLEFYSDKKGLNWFDRTQENYVQGWRIRENGRWKRGQESVDLALEAIFDVLCELPGYREAELASDRDRQIDILHELIERESALGQYFINRFGGMMSSLLDSSGRLGIKRKQSAKALLEFYSDKKGLNWFDRIQENYIQGWKIEEKGMWQRGQESVDLALEAIYDILCESSGYREAESSGNRDKQLHIIDELILTESNLTHYFKTSGLKGMMQHLSDPEGKDGLKKGSARYLLEFYSDKKGLNWFDQKYSNYLTTNARNRVVPVFADKQ